MLSSLKKMPLTEDQAGNLYGGLSTAHLPGAPFERFAYLHPLSMAGAKFTWSSSNCEAGLSIVRCVEHRRGAT